MSNPVDLEARAAEEAARFLPCVGVNCCDDIHHQHEGCCAVYRPAVAQRLAELMRERDNWVETARTNALSAEHYAQRNGADGWKLARAVEALTVIRNFGGEGSRETAIEALREIRGEK